jgi:hypothetical protein
MGAYASYFNIHDLAACLYCQLTINLSALSTSAPAPSVRVDPSVSRRGTCDRGIWTKPLAVAADAGSYAFCLGVSKFVRGQGGLIAAVSKVGWSFHSD